MKPQDLVRETRRLVNAYTIIEKEGVKGLSLDRSLVALAENITLRESVAEARERQAHSEKEAQRLKDVELEALEVRLDEALKDKRDLTGELNSLRKALSEEKQRNQTLEARVSEYDREIRAIKAQLDIVTNKLSMSQGEAANLREESARLSSEKQAFAAREITRKQLDEYVTASYGDRIEQRAQERLEDLKRQVWPEWDREHHQQLIDAEVDRLARAKLWDGILSGLNGACASQRLFQVTCDKCKLGVNFTLSPAQVDQLARIGFTNVQCPYQDCVDSTLLGAFRHQIQIRLYDLLRQLS